MTMAQSKLPGSGDPLTPEELVEMYSQGEPSDDEQFIIDLLMYVSDEESEEPSGPTYPSVARMLKTTANSYAPGQERIGEIARDYVPEYAQTTRKRGPVKELEDVPEEAQRPALYAGLLVLNKPRGWHEDNGVEWVCEKIGVAEDRVRTAFTRHGDIFVEMAHEVAKNEMTQEEIEILVDGMT